MVTKELLERRVTRDRPDPKARLVLSDRPARRESLAPKEQRERPALKVQLGFRAPPARME